MVAKINNHLRCLEHRIRLMLSHPSLDRIHSNRLAVFLATLRTTINRVSEDSISNLQQHKVVCLEQRTILAVLLERLRSNLPTLVVFLEIHSPLPHLELEVACLPLLNSLNNNLEPLCLETILSRTSNSKIKVVCLQSQHSQRQEDCSELIPRQQQVNSQQVVSLDPQTRLLQPTNLPCLALQAQHSQLQEICLVILNLLNRQLNQEVYSEPKSQHRRQDYSAPLLLQLVSSLQEDSSATRHLNNQHRSQDCLGPIPHNLLLQEVSSVPSLNNHLNPQLALYSVPILLSQHNLPSLETQQLNRKQLVVYSVRRQLHQIHFQLLLRLLVAFPTLNSSSNCSNRHDSSIQWMSTNPLTPMASQHSSPSQLSL